MAKLRGNITLNKRLREHDVWIHEPFTRGQAWVDLLLIANDAPGMMKVHGQEIPLERGQCGWSLRALEREWSRSGEWVKTFLKFCQQAGMIKVDSNARRTIITILYYDVYNPLVTDTKTVTEPDAEPDTKTVTEPDAEPDTKTVTEPERKGEKEKGKGNKEGGSATPVEQSFAEIPSQDEVLQFAQAYAGDLARGIAPRIPEAWALGWFAWRSGSGNWPKKWREDFTGRFVQDWVAGKASARAENKKIGGAVQTDGRTPASRRFELTRELETLTEHLNALHDAHVQPRASDLARERELKAELKKLGNPAPAMNL